MIETPESSFGAFVMRPNANCGKQMLLVRLDVDVHLYKAEHPREIRAAEEVSMPKSEVIPNPRC
jgi:hypothetical protein